MKTIKYLLICTLSVSCISGSIKIKAEDSYNNTTDVSEISSEDWWDVGWWIFDKIMNKMVNYKGSSYSSYDHIAVTSPDIEFNSNTLGGQANHNAEVDQRASNLIVHATRTNVLGIFDTISMGIYDANNKIVLNKTGDTGQQFTYKVKTTDAKGNWNVVFATTNNHEWICYYFQGLNGNVRSSNEADINKFYEDANLYLEDGYVSRYTDDEEMYMNNRTMYNIELNASLTMSELTEQTLDNQGNAVDSFRNFDNGDQIIIDDVLIDVSYDGERGATEFVFNDGVVGKTLSFYFKGDLTSIYHAGDSIQLLFEVKQYASKNGIKFETLNVLYDYRNTHIYPDINDYLLN